MAQYENEDDANDKFGISEFGISDNESTKYQIKGIFKAGKFHHGGLPYLWSTIFTPQRVFVLQKGRLCNVYSGIFSGNDIVIDAVQRESKQINKVLYLSPNVVIERRGTFLFARALSWDSSEVTTKYGSIKSMSWHENTGLLMTSNIGASTVKIKYASDSEAERWEKIILDEISRPKLPRKFFREYKNMTFEKSITSFYHTLDCTLWRMMISGDKSLRALYFHLTTGVDSNNDPIDNVRYEKVFTRIMNLASILKGEQRTKDDAQLVCVDENVIAYLLYRLTHDSLDRVLLLLGDFNIFDIIKISKYSDANRPLWLQSEETKAFWSRLPSNVPSLRIIHAFLAKSDGQEQFIKKSIFALLSSRSENMLSTHAEQPIVTDDGINQWDPIMAWYEEELMFSETNVHITFSLEDIEFMNLNRMWLLHRIVGHLIFVLFPRVAKSVEVYLSRTGSNNNSSATIFLRVGSLDNKVGSGNDAEKYELEVLEKRKELMNERKNTLVEVYKSFAKSNENLKFLLTEFRARLSPKLEPEIAPHLLNNLFYFEDMHLKHVISHFLKLGKANDDFIAKLLKQCLRMSQTVTERLLEKYLDILGWVLFSDSDEDGINPWIFTHDINVEKLSQVPRISFIIINELISWYSFNAFDGVSLELVYSLLTIPFRIECLLKRCGSKQLRDHLVGVETITSWSKIFSKGSPEAKKFCEILVGEKKLPYNFAQFVCDKMKKLPYLTPDRIDVNMRRIEVYKEKIVNHILTGCFAVTLEFELKEVDDSHSLFGFILGNSVPNIFDTYMKYQSELWSSIVDKVFEKFSISNGFKEKIRQPNGIMCEARHFDFEVLKLLETTTEQICDDTLEDLIMVTLKLYDYKDLKGRVTRVKRSIEEDISIKKPLFKAMSARLGTCDSQLLFKSVDGKQFDVRNIENCLNHAVTALNVLKSFPKESKKMMELLHGYIRKQEPLAWEGSFKGAYNIAVFLKYASRESLPATFSALASKNLLSGDPSKYTPDQQRLDFLIKEAKSVLPSPVITNKQIDEVMADDSPNADAYSRVLKSIEEEGKKQRTPEGKLMYELTAAWIKHKNDGESIKIAMPPRNIQLLNMLCITKWIEMACSGKGGPLFAPINQSQGKCLVTQVGTGEGKSLAIAMVAVYCVKILKKKVHVLENNEGLLYKDFNYLKPFYENYFNIKMEMSDDSTKGPPDDPDSKLFDAQVIYLTQRAMETFYKHGVGCQPCKDTVLIVDEVDQLIVDKNPNTAYGVPHTDKTADVVKCFTELRNGGKSKPQGVNQKLWNECRSRVTEAKRKIRGKDYEYKNSKAYLINKGITDYNAYTLWLEYKRFLDSSGFIGYNVDYFVQSLPHVMNQYDCIVGMSGSLGSTKEKEFLRRMYGAWSYLVPSFLDTCVHENGTPIGKTVAKLLGDQVTICDTLKDQYEKVVTLAVQKSEKVPVLIICNYRKTGDKPDPGDPTRKVLYHIEKLLQDALDQKKNKNSQLFNKHSGKDFVQRLAQQDKNAMGDVSNMEWDTIVSNATKKLDVRQRIITVTDPFGGRGFDFDVKDDYANDEGGMLVIAMSVPAERDWIQWKGRTARSDRNGQLAVILCKEQSKDNPDAEIMRLLKNPSANTASSDVIAELLALHDANTGQKLIEQEQQVGKGQRLNELCDKYHEKYRPQCASNPGGKGTIKIWPRVNHERYDNALSDFLFSEENSSDNIRQFLSSVGINTASKYPESIGMPARQPDPEPKPKRVAFLLDYSGSMCDDDKSGIRRIDAAIDCVLDVFDKYIEDGFDYVQFSLFTSNCTPKVNMSLKSVSQRQVIDGCRSPSGGTQLYTSISEILDVFTPVSYSPVNDWVIALTDGDTSDKDKKSACLSKVMSKKVNLFLIAFGEDANKDPAIFNNLNDIRVACESGGNQAGCVLAREKSKLAEALDQAVQMMESKVLST